MKLSTWLWLAGATFLAVPAFAQSSTDCDQIKSVRRMAYSNNLDESTLAALEGLYCGSTAQDCADLTILARLTTISSSDTGTIKQVNKRREQVCSSGATLGTWFNGTRIRDTSGNIYYPNNSYAKTNTGWTYLNNNTAKDSSDKWYYPNGVLARDGRKNWFDTGGTSTGLDDLLVASCGRVNESACNDWIRVIKAASGDDKTSAILTFVWISKPTATSGYPTGSNTDTTQDCQDLSVMRRLAVLSALDSSNLAVVEKRQRVVCSGTPSPSDWPNGTTAKYSNGSWNYPNGTTAKYSNGSWNDPTGSSVRNADELATQSCERIPEADCNRGINTIKAASGDDRILSIIEFSWFAWNWKDKSSGGGTGTIGKDCEILEQMGRLAIIGGGDAGNTIEKRRKSACATGTDVVSFNWSNGQSAKVANGTWYYPNGLTAFTSDGKWYYPNGVTARTSDGKWSYPSGVVARNAAGKWYTPDGLAVSVEDLLSQAGDKLPQQHCDTGLASLQTMSGEKKILGILEFVWTAWNWKGGY